jgi:hypothetical protein
MKMKLKMLPSKPFVWVIETLNTIGRGDRPVGRMAVAAYWEPIFETKMKAIDHARKCKFDCGAYRVTKYVPVVKNAVLQRWIEEQQKKGGGRNDKR